jgi:gamma-glutamyltranspeptidase/glutathione hydrolase
VSSAELYLPHGQVPAPGSLFRNAELAGTWRRLLAEAAGAGGDRERQIEAARRCWREGFVAETIDRFCRTTEAMDTSSRRHRGLLTGDDMARWQATIEAPATYDYHGYTLCKCGPWSQGPVFLQQLALLAGSDVAGLDPLGADFVHLVAESAKLAFADREAFYGDPNFVAVPLPSLLGDAYNQARRKLVTKRASRELRPGAVPGHGGPVAAAIRDPGATAPEGLGAGEPTRGRGDTCHLDVIDRHGNMVAATPSGGWLQSSPVIPGLGFCLGNRGQMFWLDEASPSALAPGKRPRTTLTPSLALRHGEPYLAFGTPGGDQQDQWSLIFFLRHIHHGMNLQEAIDAPTFNTDHLPSSFWPREFKPASLAIEGRFPRTALATLRRRGHEVTVAGDWSLGRLSAASRDGDILKAGANPRFMQGYAIGR